jgi:hypothetical protein
MSPPIYKVIAYLAVFYSSVKSACKMLGAPYTAIFRYFPRIRLPPDRVCQWISIKTGKFSDFSRLREIAA